MTDDERQIRTIVDYIEEYLPEPGPGWPKKEFERASYSRYAANRILQLLYEHPEWSAMRAVEEFRYTMSKYMYKPTNYPEIHGIFQAAYDVATDLSDILMAMTP